ncbi:RNA polymerase [Phytophthora megakarya]|uniref:RNA polymerase n=1 Tax=Phytophthora megakarya TaxID=4795 RepID=A0A225VVF0_9STRA|nr:RNA polymerase [Phytophthora megakarya]
MYKIVRVLKTVHHVWQEWAIGIHRCPAVRALETQHGSNWRNTATEKRYYFRRKLIIDRVLAIVQQENVSHQLVVCVLETHRTQEHLTIYALSDSLHKDQLVKHNWDY